GVTGVAVATMIATLSRHDQQTSRVARQILESVVGDQAAALVEHAWQDLRSRVRDAMHAEREQFETLFVQPETVRENQNHVREAAKLTEYARHTDFLEAES